jgi:hypothetical protein
MLIEYERDHNFGTCSGSAEGFYSGLYFRDFLQMLSVVGLCGDTNRGEKVIGPFDVVLCGERTNIDVVLAMPQDPRLLLL